MLRYMRLAYVRFGAFKSLYDVTCDFDELTAVTGPNGAGKSNLTEGIGFIGEAYQHSLELAVARAGGYDTIAHRRTRRARTPVSIALRVEFTAREIGSQGVQLARLFPELRRKTGRIAFEHTFSLRVEGQALTSLFRVEEDVMRICVGDVEVVKVWRGKDGIVEYSTDINVRDAVNELDSPNRNPLYPLTSTGFITFLKEQPVPSSDLIVNSVMALGLFRIIARKIAQLRIFQLSPNQCRLSGVPTPNASLSRYGENLPAVADYLQKHETEAWRRIENAMRSIIPNLAAIEVTHTEDRRLAFQFRETSVRRPWNANEMSDGTIQALALFTAIYDERTPLLVVEEPENSLHPWILRHFLDLCRESGKQVILTTHSPVLINYLTPNSLRFMWQRDGRSQWSSLYGMDPSLIELWKNGEVQAFDGYDQGLFPEVIPSHFSAIDDDGTSE
jgi:predicted ATPase